MPLTSQLVTVLVFKLVLSKKAVAGPKQQRPSPGRDRGSQMGLGGASGRCPSSRPVTTRIGLERHRQECERGSRN